jgi:multiple sugar transport system permease protein
VNSGPPRRSRWREQLEGYLFISPWLLGALTFTLGPILASFTLGFYRWDLFTAPRFTGTANFQKLSHDPLFYQAIVNTVYYAVVAVPLGLVVALGLAILVNQRLRGIALFRAAFFMPNIVAGVAMLLLWKWLFDPNFGLINELLDRLHILNALSWFGIGRPQWLTSRGGAMPALILMSLWGTGGSMMVFLAGLQSVPQELLEAAEIDGAGVVGRFRHVTLPLLTPTIFFLMVVGFIGALQTFNQAYIMTAGGPAHATLFYSLYLFQNAFEMFKMGYACAMALLLFAATLLISLLQVRLSQRWVHYQ